MQLGQLEQYQSGHHTAIGGGAAVLTLRPVPGTASHVARTAPLLRSCRPKSTTTYPLSWTNSGIVQRTMDSGAYGAFQGEHRARDSVTVVQFRLGLGSETTRVNRVVVIPAAS